MRWLKRALLAVPVLGPGLLRLKWTLDQQAAIKDNQARLAQDLADLRARLDPPRDVDAPPTSCLCTEAQLRAPAHAAWCRRFGEVPRLHRKQWEFSYICRALDAHGMLIRGRRGLGFGVGGEPLPALFASLGTTVVATDQATDQARAAGWTRDGQHASGLAAMQRPALCAPDAFAAAVAFRTVDMNAIPVDLRGFDFLWSACALEHLGSLDHAQRFVLAAMDCLVPGGIAVHTTEFTLSSDDATIERGATVLLRRRDIIGLVKRLAADGHQVAPIDWSPGDGVLDRFVDLPPFHHAPHVKLAIAGHTCTSIGLIIRKKPAA